MGFLENVGLTPVIFHHQSFIVAHEKGVIDGSFVLHNIAADYAREVPDGKILLILNQQTSAHWAAVATKLGWNYEVMRAQGQLAVLDILSTIHDFIAKPEEKHDLFSSVSGAVNPDNIIARAEEQINLLFPVDQTQLVANPKRLLIVFEDMYIFNPSIFEHGVVWDFLRHLRFIRDDIEIVCTTLITSNPGDDVGDRMAAFLAQTCSTTAFYVSPLKTGTSGSVDGEILLQKKTKYYETGPPDFHERRMYHYKIEDRVAKFYRIW